ncbi:MAG: aspartyl protease family protein [Acidobacteriota bacterium]
MSVRITCNKIVLPVWALIDSGADYSVLNASFAQIFNVDLKKGKKLRLAGVMEGNEFAGYLHQVNIAIKDVGSVDTLVAFTDSERYPDMTILGRYGFFYNFMIKFEEYKKQVEIEVKPSVPFIN